MTPEQEKELLASTKTIAEGVQHLVLMAQVVMSQRFGLPHVPPPVKPPRTRG
jgi:hypothetical protein